MNEERFFALQGVETPEIIVEVGEKDVTFAGGSKYMDADEELLQVANWIKSNVSHNQDIKPERIKYLYTTLTKKDGGRFVLGGLILRNEIEKMVNDDFDYILFVHYKTWKELDLNHKVIQLDKILCGISIDMDNKIKKNSVDSKEYINNLRYYGAETVLNSSEIIDMTVDRIIEEEKQQKKNAKAGFTE